MELLKSILLLTTLIFAGCSTHAKEKVQIKANSIIVVTASWCAPCVALKSGTLKNPDVINLASKFNVYNLEDGKHDEHIKNFGVRVYPTILVGYIGEDGKWIELDRKTGNMNSSTFLSWVGSYR